MYAGETASGLWSSLTAKRQGLITRCERYASLTIPKVCLPNGYNVESMDQTHDYQSVGAQAVNHVVNKLMTAMFAPSRPFFKVTPTKKLKEELAAKAATLPDIAQILSQMERDASAQLDSLGQRPKLYQACRHLVITGNVLLIQDNDTLRVMGLKYYVVKRCAQGKMQKLVIREQVRYDELEPGIQKLWTHRYKPDSIVSHYRLISRIEGGYYMTQWVDEARLPKEYDGRWQTDNCPYHALTWDLADESDYGTGLVEDYAGDFEALSVLSESVVTGAVVGTEFRWTVSPQGMTSVDDMRNSSNGDVLPGSQKDVGAIAPPVVEGVKIAQGVAQAYEQRIAKGFLLGSAVTRDAERVTAEEVRQNAMELESSFGGVYSSLAPSFQTPIAKWMLKRAGTSINGTQLDVVVVTGLDALSRNGDLENLRLAIADMANFATAPPGLVARIKWDALAKFIGAGRGVNLDHFLMSEQEFAQLQQQAAAAQTQQEVNTAGGVAQAEAAAQPQQ